jgi:hypothetical protein
MQAGLAAKVVDELSRTPPPKTRAEAEPVLRTLRDLLKAHGRTPCVALKKDALSRCARSALEATVLDYDGADFVRGKLTPAADGAMTLAYEFDDARELEDFQIAKGHLAEWRAKHGSGSNKEEESVGKIEDGQLLLRGNAMWRLPIGFIAPFTMRVKYSRGHVEEGKLHRMPSLGFSVCDDGKDSYVHVSAYGSVYSVDAKTGTMSQAGPESSVYVPNQTYELDIVHDGRKVAAILDGNAVAKAEVGLLRGGGIEILAVCDNDAALHRIEITGKIDRGSLAAAGKAWVKRSLLEMGF